MREESLWLVDENLERTAPVGLTLAMRVSRPETFAMTCGVMVPTNAVLIDEVLEEVQGRVRGPKLMRGGPIGGLGASRTRRRGTLGRTRAWPPGSSKAADCG